MPTCSACRHRAPSGHAGYGYCTALPPTQPNPAPFGGHHYTYRETADDLIACGMWQSAEVAKPAPAAPVLETKVEPVKVEPKPAPVPAPAPVSPGGEKPPASGNAPKQVQLKGRTNR